MSLLEAVPIWIGTIGTAGAVIAGVTEYRNEHRRRVLATASAIPTVPPGQRLQSSSPTLSTNGGGRRLKPNRGVPGFGLRRAYEDYRSSAATPASGVAAQRSSGHH
jgi:hypothetical protein